MNSLLVDVPGDYVKKPMRERAGEEITQEWLHRLGVPVADIPELAANGARCVPVMMPHVTSFFVPRKVGDRPDVVPAGAVILAFLGPFAESTRDTILTIEYSVSTGMEAAYQLLGVDRGVPEVVSSTYDVRTILAALARLHDGTEIERRGSAPVRHLLKKRITDTEISELLTEYGLMS